jgi:hypothetical protein
MKEQLQRPLNGRSIHWPKKIQDFKKGEDVFRIRPIDREDIGALALLYRQHCPYFLGSTRQSLFQESFYEAEVALLSHWEQDSLAKLYFFGVIEHVNKGRIVMGFGCRRDPYDLVIQNLAVILDPEYRNQDLSNEYVSYLDQLWEESGADYAYGLMSTQHVISQNIFLKFGAQCGGILPGIFRRTHDGKNYYRDTETIMYKFYNGAEKYCRFPKPDQVAQESLTHIEALVKGAKGKK